MQLDVFFSYACCDSYLVFAWLKQVEKAGVALDVNWRPFAIQMGDDAAYWQNTWADANSERRGFMAASAAAAQGESPFRQFHKALMRLVHEEHRELGDKQTLLGAAAIAGLDIEQFQTDWHDSHLGLQAFTSHIEGREMYRVFGTPTLLFPDGQAIHLELNQVPVLAQVVTLWQTILTVAQSQLAVRQIKRTTLV